MAPSSTETRVGFESWCKDRYYFLKTKKRPNIFHLRLSFSGTAGRNIGKFFRPGYRKFRILVIFVKTVKIMKTSSLMMCALVALTACGTGVKQECPYACRNGRADRIEDAGSQDGTDYQRSALRRSSSRDFFSGDALSGALGVLWAAAGVNREDGHLTAPSGYGALSHSGLCFSCLKGVSLRFESECIEPGRREIVGIAMQDFAYTAPQFCVCGRLQRLA